MFTKGEWKVAISRNLGKFPSCHVFSEEPPNSNSGRVICDIANTDNFEFMANANLIAAAPEMYNLLVKMDNAICWACPKVKTCEPWKCEPHVERMNVINKAEGK